MSPRGGLVAALLAVLAGPACADDGGPRLESATPAAARANDSVRLTGRRLCGGDCATAAGEVVVGLTLPAVRAVVTAYADDAATIVIPPAAVVGASELVVTVGERSSNALAFEVLPAQGAEAAR